MRAFERPRLVCRGILLDGPLRGMGITKAIPEGGLAELRVEVEGKRRRAIYKSLGHCDEVPRADGVGLTFERYADEEPSGRSGYPARAR